MYGQRGRKGGGKRRGNLAPPTVKLARVNRLVELPHCMVKLPAVILKQEGQLSLRRPIVLCTIYGCRTEPLKIGKFRPASGIAMVT